MEIIVITDRTLLANHSNRNTAHPASPARTRARWRAPEPERHSGARPGPEALYLGPSPWAVTRNQLDVPQFRRFCRALIEHYVDLLEMLAHEGARLYIAGVAGRPICGVATTSSGYTGGRPKGPGPASARVWDAR
jgi:predicted secreted protein